MFVAIVIQQLDMDKLGEVVAELGDGNCLDGPLILGLQLAHKLPVLGQISTVRRGLQLIRHIYCVFHISLSQ